MTRFDREQQEEAERETDMYFKRYGVRPSEEEWKEEYKERLARNNVEIIPMGNTKSAQ